MLTMDAPKCSLRVLQHAATAWLQVEGRATCKESLPVRRYGERCLASGMAGLQLDLRRCTYMDSTFLGTLLFLQRLYSNRPAPVLRLVAPSPECRLLLEQMGVLDIFTIMDRVDAPSGVWVPLAELADTLDLKRNVVLAHQELARVPGPAGEPFRKVMSCLAGDSEKAHE
jgi:anti-anti-sigma regulatory factor